MSLSLPFKHSIFLFAFLFIYFGVAVDVNAATGRQGATGGGVDLLMSSNYDGYVDTPNTSGIIRGWAKDTRYTNRAVVIKFYKDKSAFEGGDYLGKITADLVSNDVGQHRFEWTIPSYYLKNNTKIYVYATDIYENPVFELKSSPSIITIFDKIPYGYIDRITEMGKIFGWAKDDDTTSPIKVHFYKNGPAGVGIYIGETTANVASTDVGRHRFEWQIPLRYLDTSFRVYAHAINYPKNDLLNVKIDNSPQVFIPPPKALDKVLYIAPIWHRLDRPYSANDDFWQNMKSRLGSGKPYIKVGMTGFVQYTAHTNGPPDYDFNGSFTDLTGAPEHQRDSVDRFYSMAHDLTNKDYDIILNMSGSPWNEWFDCTCQNASIYGCSSKSNNVLTMLEEKDINVQWDQNNRTYNDSCTDLPPLQRNVTFNIYNKDVMYYMEKNIKQATKYVWGDSVKRNRTKAFSVDADAFFTVWGGSGLNTNVSVFDYNPDSIQQFRDWLFCKGEYSVSGNFPFLKSKKCFKDLAELNASLNTNFEDFVSVSPPRQVSQGFKDNNNLLWRKWLEFRQHMVFVNNYLKLLWISEAGVPADMIYGHLGTPIETPNIGNISSSNTINNMGATLDAGGVYPFGNGTNLYGNEAKNSDNKFFQKIKNVNSNWGIFETNGVALNSTKPESFNEYYKTLQQAILHGVRFLSPIAWHVAYSDGGTQNFGNTKVRDTAYEDAIREFVNTYGNYPITDMAWEFGMKSSGCSDQTGITDCNDSLEHTQLEGWSVSGYSISSLQDGVVGLTVNNSDPNFISPENLSYRGNNGDAVVVNMKVSGMGKFVPAQVFFQTENAKFWDQSKSESFLVFADDKWHKYIINIGENNNWESSKIYQLRVDVGNTSANKNVDLDYIWVTSHPKLAFDLNFDGVVNNSDKNEIKKIFTSQFDPKNIKLETVIKLINYIK